jgi:hypothetical protein
MPESYPTGVTVARLDLSGTRCENTIMMRRRLLLFGLLAGFLVLGVVGGLLRLARQPATKITLENAAKIHADMTLTEVEDILGGPARDETTGTVEVDDPDVPGLLLPFVQQWRSDTVLCVVSFDAKELVEAFAIIPIPAHRTDEGSLFDRFRRWLRQQPGFSN